MLRYEEIYNTIEVQDIHLYVNNNTDNECVASANLYKRENARLGNVLKNSWWILEN